MTETGETEKRNLTFPHNGQAVRALTRLVSSLKETGQNSA